MPESTLLSYLVSEGLDKTHAASTVSRILDGAKESDIQTLESVLCTLIADHSASPIVAEEAPPPRPDAEALKVRLPGFGDPSTKSKVAFLRVKDAAGASWLSVIALGLAVSVTGPAAAIIPSTGLIWTCYRNLIQLRRPQDAAAIDIYLALQRLRAADKAEPAPLTGTLRQELRHLDDAAFVSGVHRLTSLGLVEVTVWGGTSGDLLNSGNHLKPRT